LSRLLMLGSGVGKQKAHRYAGSGLNRSPEHEVRFQEALPL
jgi:hypothetical protein